MPVRISPIISMKKLTIGIAGVLASFTLYVPAFAVHPSEEHAKECAVEHLASLQEYVVELKELADALAGA